MSTITQSPAAAKRRGGVSFLADSECLWDVTPVTHTVLALTHPHGAAASAWSTTHWFAIGLLVGVATVFFAPGWVTGLVILFDLVALGWSSGILNYTHSPGGRWVLIAVLFLFIGLFLGVVRGLRHLSDAEFTTRLGNIRKLGRFW
jgi:putative effector of murein hydrolase LrgA (UPF0299 family)